LLVESRNAVPEEKNTAQSDPRSDAANRKLDTISIRPAGDATESTSRIILKVLGPPMVADPC
jgi:hypothetical protein